VGYKAEGSRTITVTDGPIDDAVTFTVDPAALYRFTLSNVSDLAAGATVPNITVTAYDVYDNVKTNYGGGATISSNLNNAPNACVGCNASAGTIAWGSGTGIGTLSGAKGYKAESLRHITVTAGSVIKSTNDFTVGPAALDQLTFASYAPASFVGGQPIDTKVGSVIYSFCVGSTTGLDPCTAASTPVKVLAVDPYGNRKPGIAVSIAPSPAANPASAFTGGTPAITTSSGGAVPLGEAWFSSMSIGTVSSLHTDAYTLSATGGSKVGNSGSFRIVSSLDQCTGKNKCINNTSNNSIDKPENSYSVSRITAGSFGNVVETTNFTNASDVNTKCAADRTGPTIGNAIDVRVLGIDLTSSTKPTTTMFVTLKMKTLKFYGLTARNAASYDVCLGTLLLDGAATGTQTSANKALTYAPFNRTWIGKDKKAKAKAAALSTDADGLYRWWAVVADCSASFINKAYDPCISLKSKSASAVATEMTKVTGTTWTVADVNTKLNYVDGDIGIFISKPFPWDGKGGSY
jgi:hypothetical protein